MKKLTIAQREKIVEHIPGPIEFIASRPRGDRTNATILALVHFGLLSTWPRCSKWTRTELSPTGREIAAKILAGYADALVAAGALDESVFAERPLAVLARLRAEKAAAGPEAPETAPESPVPGIPGALFPLE